MIFVGGKGDVKITDSGQVTNYSKNFALRLRGRHLSEGGYAIAVIGPPSDHLSDIRRFRSTSSHAEDIGKAISYLRQKFGVPVWLHGTSWGSVSVANAAVRLKDVETRPDGIILSASIMKANKGGSNLFRMDLDEINGPVLILHHKKDSCEKTPARKVDDLSKKLVNARPVLPIIYEGGGVAQGDRCEARHFHGFVGLDKTVANDIHKFIDDNLK